MIIGNTFLIEYLQIFIILNFFYCQQKKSIQMENKKSNKYNKIRMIVLKRQENKRINSNLDNSSQVQSKKHSKMFNSDSKRNRRSKSIAILSSIIQDEQVNMPFDEYLQYKDIDLKKQIRKNSSFLQHRTNSRNLSCIIDSDEKFNDKKMRYKTEGMNKLIHDNKIMPINKLKKGIKNISFSRKNKRDLHTDFQIYVQNKQYEPVSKDILRQDTVFFTKSKFDRQDYPKSRYNSINNHKYSSNSMNNHKKLKTEYKQQKNSYFSHHKTQSDQQNSYAKLYKKFILGFPSHKTYFKWSQLDQNERKNKFCLNNIL